MPGMAEAVVTNSAQPRESCRPVGEAAPVIHTLPWLVGAGRDGPRQRVLDGP